MITDIDKQCIDELQKRTGLNKKDILMFYKKSNKNAKKALEQLPKLKGCQVHTSVMLSEVDIKTFKKLGVDLTSEPIIKGKSN